jgi:signal transduction histidine kinase
MNNPFAKIVPSRLIVVGLGTTLFVLCVAVILLLLPGFIGRERLVDRMVESLQSMSALKPGDTSLEDLDHVLFTITQSNRANRNISYLRFVDLDDGSIFNYDEKGIRSSVGRAEPDVWADLMKKGKALKVDADRYEAFRIIASEHPIAINLGIDPEVAHEIESQRRLSIIVGSIILATGIGILIMIWQTRQIEEAKGELELVLASTSEPILMVDNYCRLVFANEPACALLGHPKGKKFRNRPLLSLIQNASTREFFERLLANERSNLDELETTLAGYPEKITFRAGVLDVKTSVGRTLGKLLALRNVTLEKRLEDKKVSQTIHELKGMLGEVKGFIRHALDTMDGDAQREQRAFLNICLEKLERSYDTVAAMVKSIVSAFKPQSLELRLRHVDLGEIIKFNVNDFESSIEKEKAKGLVIRVNLPEKLPTVCCDANAISRVLVNLFQNAFQHCPQGAIEVTAEEKGETVQVQVKDAGCGIPPGNLDIIFEPHVSFRKGGTGVGLSICRDFIKAHGGEIWAHSNGKDKGSAFYFNLPKSRPVILASDAGLAARLDAHCKKNGYFPIILNDFLAATRKVAEINPNAILLDIDMQDTISGISLAYRLKKTADTAKIPIIGLTSCIPDAQAELDRYEGISLEAFLQKDFKEDDIGAAIKTVEAYWYLAQSS